MTAAKHKQLITRLFETFKSQDQEVVESLLAPTFRFTSPYDDAIDRAAYLERCWPNATHLTALRLEHILCKGQTACVVYQASTPEGVDFRNTEIFTFAQDQIVKIEVFFGAVYQQGVFTRMR